MKWIFGIIIMILVYSCKTKQVSRINFELPFHNVLYSDIKNPINIVLCKSQPREIETRISNGKITKEDSQYFIVPDVSTRICELKIGFDENGQFKTIDSMSFRVRPLPNPKVQLGNTKSGRIIKPSILFVRNVMVTAVTDFAMGVNFEITSFDLVIVKKGQAQSHHIEGNAVPDNIVELFKELQKGDCIIIENAKAKYNNTLKSLDQAIYVYAD